MRITKKILQSAMEDLNSFNKRKGFLPVSYTNNDKLYWLTNEKGSVNISQKMTRRELNDFISNLIMFLEHQQLLLNREAEE